MVSQEKEYFFKHIKDAIATLRLGLQRTDNKRFLKRVQAIYRYKLRAGLY